VTLINRSRLADVSDYDYTVSDYDYVVSINDRRVLARGKIEGHRRKDGWQALVARLLDAESKKTW
jgi:hypothetical protein